MRKPSGRLSPAEPVTALRHVPIRDNGDLLVDFTELYPRLIVGTGTFQYRRVPYLRAETARRVNAAAEALPDGYQLVVMEGWRAPHVQRRMHLTVYRLMQERNPDWSEVKLRRVVNRYTAPLHARVPPPHSTGGAVDVMLAGPDGKVLEHSTGYSGRDTASFPMWAPNLTEEARNVRAVLDAAMRAGGLTNYPSEFWHWSYGDQGWAYRGSQPVALYGRAQPAGWLPDPTEDIDDPFDWKDE